MKRKMIAPFVVIIMVIILAISLLTYFKYDRGLTTHFTSAQGKEVIVRYDFASRPTVFYQNKIVWVYEGAGFMESVSFDVHWITENEILLTQNIYNIRERIFLA